jgi:superfamily II DNA or RNA helicase
VDVAMLPTLARRPDVAELTAEYGFIVVDECHHVPAAAFEHAIKKIPARCWLGLTATPYRRDKLDELIFQQIGPIRHTVNALSRVAKPTVRGELDLSPGAVRPELHIHLTGFLYSDQVDVSASGGMATVYRELIADEVRTGQVLSDVMKASKDGRNCLLLTQWTAHVERFAELLRENGFDPVVLRGGMGVKERKAALARLDPSPGGGPLMVVATGPYVGEGFDCPALDTLFLASPIASKGRLVQYAGRILRTYPGKVSAEVHDYHDVLTGVLASSLAKRAPGYVSLGFPDPRKSR